LSHVVTVYAREGCHLCEVALDELRRLGRADLEIETVDIEADDELLARYLERIPVVALDGVELYDFHVDTGDLLQRLDRHTGR